MFDATTLAAYLVAAVALILSPGPDTAYVLARGAGEGRRAGVLSALGVATGVLVHTVAAAIGLAALFRAVPEARTVVVAAGAAYLSYLGVRTLRDPEVEARETDGNPYLQGLTVNVLNPQVALFFLAFLPGFAPDSAPAAGMVLLGALYAAITAAYLGGVGALSGNVGGESRRMRLASGVVLLGVAGWLIVTNVSA
ncbi:LysE family translocator [Halobacteriales archaeon QS_9_68_42]|nr:MAG: LysE family translocator [Halobacteriales archaeon QS_1_68_44]PSQ42569.1 MAG: LysE family translocator [Halobacteriales archaeon QS_9_68_42]